MYNKINRIIYPAAYVIGISVSLLHIFLCFDIYSDIAYAYLPMVRGFVAGNWRAAFSGLPVLVPAMAGIIAKTGLNEFTCIVVVSCIFYIATIPVMYRFVKYFFPEGDYAAWGAFLYAIAPKIIRFGCTGLLNSSRNFFLILAVYLIFSYKRKARISKLIYLGLSLAGLALARGEGSLAIPVIFLGAAVLILADESFKLNSNSIKKTLTVWGISGFVLLAAVAPRLIQTYHDFGVPFLDARQASFVEKVTAFKLNDSWDNINTPKPFPRIIYKHYIPAHKEKTPLISIDRISKFLGCLTRGAYEIYLVLAALGLFFWIYRRKGYLYEFCVIAAVTIMYCATYYCIVSAYRYFTFVLLMIMPLTLQGCKEILSLLARIIKEKYLKPILAVGLIIITAAQIKNGLEKIIEHKYDFERKSGEWLWNYAEKSGPMPKLRLDKPVLYTQSAPVGYWSALYFEPFQMPADKKSAEALKKQLIENVDFIVLEAGDLKANDLIQSTRAFRKLDNPFKQDISIYVSIHSNLNPVKRNSGN
ncbi:glycosyltransferase family 39 protein [Lentisphaerota bacterium ZTH]|nr:glycosyltransferase family 39 protein [Lentisphaerota bacterium]WET05742.1 glycosyltransferase family 39 protein [Lentisphaerota bacterium ZTH]